MAKRQPPTSSRQAKRRCAIYTRKSSEEGLEQDFNSLDAQREACEAYIASQRHEGWAALPQMYDDGGFSGGSMDRPALQRLLADVAAGKIDVVVVYKVDRLTRSLSDFAKIVDIFDRRTVSIVSVAQSFNTTSSMGRLTLNVLLSFAQFEREVTGERIRDKIAASKKKGMWMGGQPPLGYDAKDRKLVVNEAEADTVRHIFRRYAALRSVRLLQAELEAQGITSKRRVAADGIPYGGKSLARGALYAMLSNRIYRGEIVHKAAAYPGEHPAIVDEALWAEVQEILSANRVERNTGAGREEPSLLAGMIYDARGERLTPSHAVKRGTRYRYYVSQPLLTGAARDRQSGAGKLVGQRLPAAALEGLVKNNRLWELLASPAELMGALQDQVGDATEQKQMLEAAAHRAEAWREFSSKTVRRLLLGAVPRIQVHLDRVEIMLDPLQLARWLKDHGEPDDRTDGMWSAARLPAESGCLTLIVPAQLKRVGFEMQLVVNGAEEGSAPDASISRILVRAHAIRDRLMQDASLTVEEVARQEELVPSYVTRLLRLTYLAPDIITGLLTGKHPLELTARKLMSDTRLPLDWSEQRRQLGFAAV